MLQVYRQSKANEEEVAACLAVLAFLDLEKEEAERLRQLQSPPSGTTNWQLASRLNKRKANTFRLIPGSTSPSLWQLSSRLLFILVVLLGHYNSTKEPASASEPTIQKLNAAESILLPAAPEPVNTSVLPKSIRVGLISSSAALALQLPDGAQIIDEASGELVAELPPLSNWKVSMTPASLARQNLPSLVFSGNLLNIDANQVMLARQPDSYQPASLFTPRTAAIQTNRPEFRKAPYILARKDPQFWLPVKLLPPPPSIAPGKSDNIRNQDPAQTPAKALPLKSSSRSGYRVLPVVPDGVLGANGKLYRGSLLLLTGAGNMAVVNEVNLEDYLLSVVASEMPSGWPIEALKAQSIAARSYALANLGKNASQGFDVKPTVEDQVYLGIQAEKESSNYAVQQTAGLILKHEGQPVTAYFHSSSGGHTDLSEHLWSKKTPYLKAVPDYDNDSPHFAWTKQYTVESMESSLKKAGKDPGALMALLPIIRSPAQRVSQILIAGSLQTTLLSGEDIRKLLSLPSSIFNVNHSSNGYIFAGRGWGHGLGMSQWGAKALAEKGFNCAEILSYYYKDVTLEPM